MQEIELHVKNKLVQQLLKPTHSDLNSYLDVLPLAIQDKNLFSHYITWNNIKSKIDDSKCALPIIGLRTFLKVEKDYAENAIANLMTLNPRNLYKAYQFSRDLSDSGRVIIGGWRKLFQESIQKYLEIREGSIKWWDNAVVRSRKAMLGLYAISHKKPSDRAQEILFKKQYPKSSVFQIIKDLKTMSPLEACGQIIKHNIPMSVIIGSGVKVKGNKEVLLAMVEGMTGNEILNSSNMLKNLGAFDFSEVKAAYDNAIERAKTDKRVNTFKASKAIKQVDKKIADKIITIQNEREKEIPKITANTLILGDSSGSMRKAIEITKQIAGVISSNVVGDKYLIFFNTHPRLFYITNKTYADICVSTKDVKALGSTSIGCGLKYLMDKNIDVDIIIIVSDGGDNSTPYFTDVYPKYCKKFGKEPTIYFFHVKGDGEDDLSKFCKAGNININYFEVDVNFDYYALPNILQTVKLSQYDLLNEILDVPLLTLEKVFYSTSKNKI